MKKTNKNMITLVALCTLLAVVVILFTLTFFIKPKRGSGNNPTLTPAITAGGNSNTTPSADPTTAPTQAADVKPAKPSISSYATDSDTVVSVDKIGDEIIIGELFKLPEGTVFTVADPEVATVDETGKVKTKSKGVTTVDATYTDEDGKTTSVTVGVEVGLSKVTPVLGTNVILLEKKEEFKIPFSLIDEDGDDVTSLAVIDWDIIDSNVATVNENGVVSPVADGQSMVSISAKYRGQHFGFNIPAYVAFKNPVENIDIGHTHVFVLVSNSATSCDTAGEIVYQCSCGAEQKETFDKLGHNYQLAETFAASCAIEGHLTYTCSRCGDSYQESIAKTDHTYALTENVSATCTAAGHTTYTCSGCGTSYQNLIAATGHSYKVTETVASTCTAEGHKTSTCSKCGDVKTETSIILGHNYKYAVKPATCSEAGEAYDKCTRCGDIKNKETLPKTEHSKTLDVMNPDCTHTGYQKEYCKVCGEVFSYEEYPYNHNYVKSMVDGPYCTEDGYILYSCQKCGANKVENLPSTGHNYQHVDKAATCTEAGESYDKCTNKYCASIINKTTTPATGHNYVVTETVASTCSAEGHKTSKCSKCGNIKTEAIAKAAHNYQHKQTAATCLTDGESYDQCKVCGNKANQTTIPATGHNLSEIENVAATCTADGYKKLKCSKCGAEITEKTDSKLGHNYVRYDEDESNFDFCYMIYYKCSRCGDYMQEWDDHDFIMFSKYDYESFSKYIGNMEDYEDLLAPNVHIYYCTKCHYWATIVCTIITDAHGNRTCEYCHAIIPSL